MKGKENSNLVKVRKRPFKITWTDEEDRILFSMAELDNRKSWKSISKMLNNKTPSQCFYRFHARSSPNIKKNWTKDEDKIIKEFVQENGKKWDELANILSYRTPKQIKERFLNKLDDSIIRSKFSGEEDEKIISLYLKYGSKWSFISRFFSGRTPDMIKSRFYSSLQKKILYGEEDNNKDKEVSEYQNYPENSNSFREPEKHEIFKTGNLKKQKRTQLKKKLNKIIIGNDLKAERNDNPNTCPNSVNFKNHYREQNNNTLTDISFDNNSEKDSNLNSNSVTNSNSNPFDNNNYMGIAEQTNKFKDNNYIELINEDNILKQNEISDEQIEDAVENINHEIINYNNCFIYNNNYNSYNNANHFYCDISNNLNYYHNSNQFEFISYIQKQIQENIFEAIDD